MHPTGGSLRVFRQFAWLEVGSDKLALARDIMSPLIFSIFAGPLGAVLGAYISVFWKTTGTERKLLVDSLFPKLGGIVGVILVFWITAVTIFSTFEDMVPGILYGGCVGRLMTPLGAVGGKYLAKYLMKVWSKEENSN